MNTSSASAAQSPEQSTSTSHNSRSAHAHHHGGNSALLMLTALGVVFGDIGTSPLYALRECFAGHSAYPITRENVYGLLSLFFWSLNIVVSLKYVLFIMHANNKGEGGILALESLAKRSAKRYGFTKLMPILTLIGLFGSALLYGVVLPATIVILIGLFSVQRFGTAKIGAVFGPITLVWFLVMGALGLRGILQDPAVLVALNPMYALNFFLNNGPSSILILGTVFLCVTGGEAMYADMGHFGRIPIKRGWFFISLPCLALNYFGQGALILGDPSTVSNPFYKLSPEWALYPLVGLATAATVIASQALISGVFSLTRQAVQLGYAPRMRIIHTSSKEIGQIYVPVVNWALLIGAICLVLVFKSSSAIAHAYGIAVSLTMLLTTLLAVVVARHIWHWRRRSIAMLCIPLLIVDTAFFGANATKFFEGGWIPLAMACVLQLLATTWIRGRELLGKELSGMAVNLDTFFADIEQNPPVRVPGTAVFMTGLSNGAPLQLINLLRHTKALHERILLFTFKTLEVPHVDSDEGIKIEELRNGVWRIIRTVGYMDTPDVQEVVRQCKEVGFEIDMEDTAFFLGREVVLATTKVGMAIWRERLFAFMSRNALSPAAFFNIPPARVIEVGIQVEI
jgi:KUP system potassium uptake protein